MILDAFLLFDNNSAITAGGPSGNVIDLLHARDIAIGYPLLVLVQPIVTFTAGGAATMQVQFQGSADNTTWSTYVESLAQPLANLVVGKRPFGIHVPRPEPDDPLPRYLRLNYVIGTGPMLTGRVTSGILLDRDDQVYYRPGLAVAN
jgi:hypothetical protein